jgi:hypothetical protein
MLPKRKVFNLKDGISKQALVDLTYVNVYKFEVIQQMNGNQA